MAAPVSLSHWPSAVGVYPYDMFVMAMVSGRKSEMVVVNMRLSDDDGPSTRFMTTVAILYRVKTFMFIEYMLHLLPAMLCSC